MNWQTAVVVVLMSVSFRCVVLNLPITVRGFAQRGFQGYNVSKLTKTSKQLDDFLKRKTPRCAKPLLVAEQLLFFYFSILKLYFR
jgi:hypothetical protein